MIRKKLVVVLFVAILSSSFAPQKAEALEFGGLIDMFCWHAAPPGGATGPNPTVGCTLLWGPGGFAQSVDWRVLFNCLTTGCIIIGNPPPYIALIVEPGSESGTKFHWLRRNCLGQPAQVTVNSFALAIKSGGGIAQHLVDEDGFLVPVFCPGSSGGAVSTSP